MNPPAPEPLEATCPFGHSWRVSSAALQDGLASTSCPSCGAIATIVPGKSPQTEDATPALPEIPGFEILGELGRGGMGVVYQARQLSPERTVALKMIRLGLGTSDEILSRFRGEAEAIAKLEHPHIVRIYAVGDTREQMYLVLEYVAGGSLSERFNGKPQPPRESAEMVETLARAIHFAHERKFIHRDLKPANVLLSEDGTPKITDFGLAKQLDSELGETQTGEILGTLLYMAPEQATGVTRNMGPAVDIHALGVMLYEMLTGRRPFEGGDVIESLTLLTTTDPISPRRLMPSVPRDLELICLKCLRKVPSQRYESAAALADDLRCYLDGKPIQAKPQSTLDRVQKWVRRRPALAALLAGLVLVPILAAAGFYWHGRELGQQLQRTEQQRARAEANLSKTQASVDELLTEINTGAFSVYPESSELRTQMLNWAMQLCEELRMENPGNPYLRLQAARALRQKADIQRLLGEEEKALASYEQGGKELMQLLEEQPKDKEIRKEFGTLMNNRGLALQETDRRKEAPRSFEAAMQVWVDLTIFNLPDEFDFQLRKAGTLINLGLLFQQGGSNSAGQKNFEEAIGLLSDSPDNLTQEEERQKSILLASALTNLGRSQHALGEFARAEQSFQAALEVLRKQDTEHRSPEARIAMATIHNNLATVYSEQEDSKATKAELSDVIELLDQLTLDFPDQPRFYEMKLAAQLALIPAIASEQERAQIEQAFAQVREAYQRMAVQFPRKVSFQQGEVQTLQQQAKYLFTLGEESDADAILITAIGMQYALAEKYPKEPEVQSQLGRIEQMAGRILMEREDWEDAAKHFEKAILAGEQAVKLAPKERLYISSLRDHYEGLAKARLDEGNIAAAAQVAQQMAVQFSDEYQGLDVAANILLVCHPLAVALKGEQKIDGKPVDLFCKELLQSAAFERLHISARFLRELELLEENEEK